MTGASRAQIVPGAAERLGWKLATRHLSPEETAEALGMVYDQVYETLQEGGHDEPSAYEVAVRFTIAVGRSIIECERAERDQPQ